MRTIKTTIILITLMALAFVTGSRSFSQGCSDAGVCSIHGITPGSTRPDTAKTLNNAISAGVSWGMSQYDVQVLTPFVEYTRSLGKHFSLTGKFNFGLRFGELGNTGGPSDLLLSGGYDFLDHFTLTAGIKIPMNDGNLEENGQPLPMNYQTSLGTVDLLLGFGYRIKRWSFTAGYQQPVTQNGNQFLASAYPEGSPESKYYSTRNYHRAADVLVRASFTAIRSQKVTLVAGILPIYHVQNDSYEEPDGRRVSIDGSQGLTLNINAIVQYHITASQHLELTLGAPALARKVRPDGLSKFAAGISYMIRL